MKREMLIISALIALILFSGFAYAEETSSDEILGMQDEVISVDNSSNNQLGQNVENIYQAENSGTFTQLNTEITSNNEVNLSKNYTYTSRYDSALKNGIIINKNITINGNNFTIDGNGMNSMFNIQNNAKLILNDVCIINTFTGDTSIIINQGDLSFNNVNFTSFRSISTGGSGYFRDIYNTGSLTIANSNFINSQFEITATSTTNLNNLNIRGFIDNEGNLSIANTLFDNNLFKPTNQIGRSHEISTILFNNAPNTSLTLNNISVTNNKVRFTSSAQEVFRGFIRNENGNLIIKNSLFENNTALFPNSNSQCLGILSAGGDEILINNTIFKTNEFNDAIITSAANNTVIIKSVFDSNTIGKNIIQNSGSGTLNATHNIFLNNAASRLIDSSSNFLININENYWGTNEPDFRNIASVSTTPNYIILNFTGPTEVNERETNYTISLKHLNTNETVKDYVLNDYYIEVQSNNLGTATPVWIKNGIGYYVYAPIDKGEDILSAGSIKLRVNVTTIFLSATIQIITEYSETAFAGTNNSIIAKIFVNKDFGIYTIKLYANGIEIGEEIQDLSRKPKEIIFLDETIRPINETTVAGANNPQINYTVEVYRNDELIGNTTSIVPLLYNGYLGKDYGYPINDIEFNYCTTINGDIYIQLQDDTTYMDSSKTQREFEWRTVLSSTCEFTAGFLYIPYNWDKTTTGPYPEFNLIFNGEAINSRVVGKYKDQANVGIYGSYGYGVLIYDVTEYLQNGRNTLKLEKENGLTAVYPPTLVTLFNTTDSESLKTVYINNGADLLYNEYNLANRSVQTNAQIMIPDIANMTKATLYVFAAGASENEADFKFNNNIYRNIWENSTGTNYHGAFIADVTNIIETSNHAEFISTGGTILSLQNILIISHPLVKEKTQINLVTEYVNTAYAGTNNTITVNIKVNRDGNYDIRLLANGTEVANINQDLTKEWTNILLTDQTIRPIDETTVSGAQNQKINYTLEVYKDGKIVANSTIIVPLLYNGYLGKEYEYPIDNLEFDYKNSINGDILIQIQNDDTYLGLSQTNRIDNWEIVLSENSNIINGFLYISYNWDKSSTEYPALTLTFNGRNIENKLVGRYKDQSNLGSTGRYGYGLLIYDVSDLVFKGQNSLILKKENGLTAVYPSTLITIYNTTGSNNLKNIIIDNDADLIFNQYNLANRSIQSNNQIELTHLEKTTLYVFASSANNGDADLRINNNTYSNIWRDYESTNHAGVFEVDVTNIIKTNNEISFIATGGTILALQQIIVTENVVNDNNNTSGNNNATPKKTTSKKTATKLTAKKKTYKVKTKNKKISATLKTKAGKAIKGVKITFKVKGKTYKAKTNKKGIATVKVKINKRGKYTVTIKFAGNKLYSAKTIKSKIIIKK